MAPSVLLQSEPSPAPYSHPTKQAKADGVTSLEAQAPVDGSFSFRSSSANGDGNAVNGSTNSNGFARHQQEGRDFIASHSLPQSLNSSSAQGSGGEAKKPNILYIMADQMAAPFLKMNDPE